MHLLVVDHLPDAGSARFHLRGIGRCDHLFAHGSDICGNNGLNAGDYRIVQLAMKFVF